MNFVKKLLSKCWLFLAALVPLLLFWRKSKAADVIPFPQQESYPQEPQSFPQDSEQGIADPVIETESPAADIPDDVVMKEGQGMDSVSFGTMDMGGIVIDPSGGTEIRNYNRVTGSPRVSSKILF